MHRKSAKINKFFARGHDLQFVSSVTAGVAERCEGRQTVDLLLCL
jgi:hypothetical protein